MSINSHAEILRVVEIGDEIAAMQERIKELWQAQRKIVDDLGDTAHKWHAFGSVAYRVAHGYEIEAIDLVLPAHECCETEHECCETEHECCETEQAPTIEAEKPEPSGPAQKTPTRGDLMKKLHGVGASVGLGHEQIRLVSAKESLADLSDSEIEELTEEIGLWSLIDSNAAIWIADSETLDELKERWAPLASDVKNKLIRVKDRCKAKLLQQNSASREIQAKETEPAPQATEYEQGLDPSVCKGCGAKILFGITQAGKACPVDLPEKRALEGEGGREDKRYIVNRSGKLAMTKTWHPQLGQATADTYMPHHYTCPDAKLFKR